MGKIGVIIVAGGAGHRMGGSLPKQFMILGNEPILLHTIRAFSQALPQAEIVVSIAQEYIHLWENLASRFDVPPHKVVAGGSQRFHSVKNALESLSPTVERIVVHDAVRPLLSKRLIISLILALDEHQAVIPVISPVDSIREIEHKRSKIVDRTKIRMVQTPQVFQSQILREAYQQEYNPQFTDDASVIEAIGYTVHLIDGEPNNIKITTPIDMLIAQAILDKENEE